MMQSLFSAILIAVLGVILKRWADLYITKDHFETARSTFAKWSYPILVAALLTIQMLIFFNKPLSHVGIFTLAGTIAVVCSFGVVVLTYRLSSRTATSVLEVFATHREQIWNALESQTKALTGTTEVHGTQTKLNAKSLYVVALLTEEVISLKERLSELEGMLKSNPQTPPSSPPAHPSDAPPEIAPR